MNTPRIYANARPGDFTADVWLPKGVPPFPCDVLLVGPPGTGKTHAAWGLLSHWGGNGFGIKAEVLAMEYQTALSGKGDRTGAELIADMAAYPVLLVDDLGANRTDDRNTAMLVTLLSLRIEEGRSTIITTNLPRADMDLRLSDRLSGFRLVALKGDSRRKARDGELPEATPAASRVPPWIQHHGPYVERWMALSNADRRRIREEFSAGKPGLALGSSTVENPDVRGVWRWSERIVAALKEQDAK